MNGQKNYELAKETLHRLQDGVSVQKIPVETIVNEVLQMFAKHNLTVYGAQFVLKKIKDEVKRQSSNVRIANENQLEQLRRQSDSDCLVEATRNNQTNPENTDPSK
jgi:hypothetical protein